MRTWPLFRPSTACVLVALSMFFFASNIVVGRFGRVDIPPFGLPIWRTALKALAHPTRRKKFAAFIERTSRFDRKKKP